MSLLCCEFPPWEPTMTGQAWQPVDLDDVCVWQSVENRADAS